MGPLAGAFILPRGQRSIAWFSFVALLGILLLADIGTWTKRRRAAQEKLQAAPPRLAGHVVEGVDAAPHAHLPRKKIFWSLAILVALDVLEIFYLASLGSYYTFYLMDKFHVSVRSRGDSFVCVSGRGGGGTFFGGPVGDRMGARW